MTATDELRRMLDEREVDYRVSATGYSIDIGPYTTAYANRSDTTLDVSLRQVTPEQAIEATLGRGTCSMSDESYGYPFTCSACGARFDFDSVGDEWVNYCPVCGRKVVD